MIHKAGKKDCDECGNQATGKCNQNMHYRILHQGVKYEYDEWGYQPKSKYNNKCVNE